MVALIRRSKSYSHTLSEEFIAGIKKSVYVLHHKKPGWNEVVRQALAIEFPTDFDMRRFAEEHFPISWDLR